MCSDATEFAAQVSASSTYCASDRTVSSSTRHVQLSTDDVRSRHRLPERPGKIGLLQFMCPRRNWAFTRSDRRTDRSDRL